jgi:hypothetical protein
MLLPVQECGKGVNKDLLPSELLPGVWSDSSNVRFRNGFAEKRKGMTAVYTTPTATPYWIGTYSTSTTRFLVQLGTATAFVDDGATRTDITGSAPTGSRDDRWTGGDFNGVFFCNNGVDSPMYWNGNTATNLAAITAWTAGEKADAMRAFKNYLFGISITKGGTKYPYRLRWSNAAEPGSLPTAWTAAATNDAGEQDLVGAGHLIDALPLNDSLIVYGQEGRYAVRYIGGNDVFSFQQLPGKDGLLTRGCVVSTPRGHVFLTNGDVRLHSGGESISIADGIVRKWITGTMDTSNAARSFVVVNPQESEVWVVFPSSNQNDCDTVASWNWNAPAGEGWSIFTVPSLTYATAGLISTTIASNTYDSVSATVTYANVTSTYNQNEASSNESRLLVVTSNPVIGLANIGSLDFGNSIDWHLEKTGIPLSDQSDLMRCISRLRPNIDGIAGAVVAVKLATTKAPDDAPTFSTTSNYTQGTTTDINQFTTAGRYGAVRFEGTDDRMVAMRSYRLEVADSGSRF